MNGRVYDPTLGRFLSADPFVPNPTATQSFNRYSYVNNNPLSYTDPSGFWGLGDIGDAIGGALGALGEALGNALGLGQVLGALAQLDGLLTAGLVGAAIGALGGPFGIIGGVAIGMIGYGANQVALGFRNEKQTADTNFGDGHDGSGGNRADGIQVASADQFSDAGFPHDGPGPNGQLWSGNSVQLVQDRYDALQNRVETEAQENPYAVIELSQDDIDTIAEMMSVRADSIEPNPFLSEGMQNDFKLADTFLWGNLEVELSGVRFYVPSLDRVSYGGDINYIAVGAMAGRYGYSSSMLARLVEIWNVGQYITGQGDHNISQIKTGGYWAQYGLNYYKNRQDLK